MGTSESLFSKVPIRCNTTSNRLAKHHRLFSMFSSKIRYITSLWSVDPKDMIRYIRYIRVQKRPHPHGKIRVHPCAQKYSCELLLPFDQWGYDYRYFFHCFCFIIGIVDNLQECFLHVVWLTLKWCLRHQVHQPLLHASMIWVLSCCLIDIAAYLLAFLLVVPYLYSFH